MLLLLAELGLSVLLEPREEAGGLKPVTLLGSQAGKLLDLTGCLWLLLLEQLLLLLLLVDQSLLLLLHQLLLSLHKGLLLLCELLSVR